MNATVNSPSIRQRISGIFSLAAIALCALAFGATGVEPAGATITRVEGRVLFDCKPGLLVAYAPSARNVFGNRPNSRINLQTRVQWLNGNEWLNAYTTPSWAYASTVPSGGGYAEFMLAHYSGTGQAWFSTGAIANQHQVAGTLFPQQWPWVNISVPRGYTYRVLTLFHDQSDGTSSWVVNQTSDGYQGCRQ